MAVTTTYAPEPVTLLSSFKPVSEGLITCPYTSHSSAINPFVSYAPFLYPLKTSENLTVFCFQGVEKRYIGKNGLN